MVSKKPSILIVDDEPTICELLSEELSERGYLCATAYNGNDALLKLAQENTDVVLLDIRLPGQSGIEVLNKIRIDHSNVATIMITAINDVDTAVKAIKLGASDYITKPFQLEKVGNSIQIALEEKVSRQVREAEPADSETSRQLNAIARGVEARLDSIINYSKIVTHQTEVTARFFGIPEREVIMWSALRASYYEKKKAAINYSLQKLERNPIAQGFIGLTVSHQLFNSDKYQN